MWLNLKIRIIQLLNEFCFSNLHDDNCCGCIFKNSRKCPLNTVVEKMERNI